MTFFAVLYRCLPHNDLWMTVCSAAVPLLCVFLTVGICLLWERWLSKIYAVFNGGRM